MTYLYHVVLKPGLTCAGVTKPMFHGGQIRSGISVLELQKLAMRLA